MQLQGRYMFVPPSFSAGALQDALNSSSVVASDKTNLVMMAGKLNLGRGSCDLVLLDEQYFETGFGIALPKGTPFKEDFDKA